MEVATTNTGTTSSSNLMYTQKETTMKLKQLLALVAFVAALCIGLGYAQPTFASDSNPTPTPTPTIPPYHPNGLIWES